MLSVIAKVFKTSGAEAKAKMKKKKKKNSEEVKEMENKAAMIISFAKFKQFLLFGKVNLAAKITLFKLKTQN